MRISHQHCGEFHGAKPSTDEKQTDRQRQYADGYFVSNEMVKDRENAIAIDVTQSLKHPLSQGLHCGSMRLFGITNTTKPGISMCAPSSGKKNDALFGKRTQ